MLQLQRAIRTRETITAKETAHLKVLLQCVHVRNDAKCTQFRKRGVRVTRLFALRKGCVIYLYQMSNTLPDLTARNMNSSILNMLPENRFKRPLMLITETWDCGSYCDVALR